MKKKYKKLILWLVLAVLVFIVFKNWFVFEQITAGDAAFHFDENLKDLSLFPYSWVPMSMGRFSSFLLSFLYLIFPLKVLSLLNFSWVLIERFVWYWPFLVLSIFSSWFLLKTILPKIKFSFLAPLIYLLNSYILMIIGGGQISIALGYAIAPLVIALFIKSADKRNLALQTLSGLILSLQVVFEPRMAVLTMFAVVLYVFFEYRFEIAKYIKLFFIPLVVAIGIHFYWLFPLLFLRKQAYSSTLSFFGWVKFLSFADFSKTFSLLHPNWPENIFGKTYFMRPEFLIIPILAFVSLLFVNRLRSSQIKKNILFFAFLALIGAFLAKGSNPPFGEAYLWLFNNFPGMNLFRDSTKFYVLIALSYSILIPFSVAEIYKRLKTMRNMRRATHYLSSLFVLLVVCYLLLLIKPAILGQLGGTFKAKEIPRDYIQLKNFIENQDEFSRTLWVPKKQRFGFFANNHPAISAETFVTDSVCQEPFCSLKEEISEKWGKECLPNDRCYVRELSYFLNPKTAKALSLMAVKYVIVPFDSEGEIFLAERKYNQQQREEVEEFLNTILWLKKIDIAGKIAVYEIPSHKDHFFALEEEIGPIEWNIVNPTKYIIRTSEVAQPFELVFSETYDELWQAKIGERIIPSRKWNNLNSFSINQTGDLEIVAEFAVQKYVYLGGIISLLTLLASFSLLGYFCFKKED